MTIYSHSRLSTFENCPLRYKYSYIDKIPREEEGIEAFMGSRFHEAMEKLYSELKFRVIPLDEILAYYDDCWKKEYHDDVVISKKDRTATDYKHLGKKCIEDYYRRYQPFDQGRLLALEKNVTFDLKGDGKYRITGYIDRLVEFGDGAYEIHDYKTSGRLPEQKELDVDRQLALYHLGIQEMWSDVKKVKLVWHYVVFDKEMASSRTEKQLARLKGDTITLIDRIEQTHDFLPRESNLCDWCPYPDLCPKRKHLFKVESLPANKYLKDSGVKLVNAYAELAAKRKKHRDEIVGIEDEMEKIEEAILKYAEREKIEVMRGGDHTLKINEKTRVSSPQKGTPDREELEGILKEAGKWDEISTLDSNALSEAVTEKRWDKKILSRIMKYLTIDRRTQIYLSKLREEEDA